MRERVGGGGEGSRRVEAGVWAGAAVLAAGVTARVFALRVVAPWALALGVVAGGALEAARGALITVVVVLAVELPPHPAPRHSAPNAATLRPKLLMAE